MVYWLSQLNLPTKLWIHCELKYTQTQIHIKQYTLYLLIFSGPNLGNTANIYIYIMY